MGNAQVMTAKVAWDNACYWSVTALLYFQRRFTQPEFIRSIEPLMRRFFVLHARMQQFLRAWDLADDGATYATTWTSVLDEPWLRALQSSLADAVVSDDDLRKRLTENMTRLESFASAWQNHARVHHPALPRFVHDVADTTPVDLSAFVFETTSAAHEHVQARPFS
jgi:hypothetical protein